MARISTESIFAAARKCITEYGLNKTTITDIANRADVSRMTIYRRWKNANDLVLDMLTHDISRMVSNASNSCPATKNGRERLVCIALDTLEALGKDEVFKSLRAHDPLILTPYILERTGASQKVLIEAMRSMLQAGMEDGSIRKLPLKEATYMLIFTMQIFVLSYDVIEHEVNLEGVIAELKEALIRYLKP